MVRDVSISGEVDFLVYPTSEFYGLTQLIDHQLSLDASRAPYGQFTATFPLDEAVADGIDPIRTDTIVTAQVHLQRNLGADDEQQDRLDFGVRGVTRNYRNGTMTVRCTTAEAAADTYAHHASTPFTWAAGTPVTTVVNNVLSMAGLGGLAVESAPTPDTLPEEFAWQPGDTALSVLQSVVQPTGRKIIHDTSQRWLLIDPTLPVTTGPTAPRIYPMADVIELEERNDLDAGHYADNVVLVYEWANTAGAVQTRVAVSESTVLAPTWHAEKIDGRYPGAKAAAALRNRLQVWGRERTFRILWDLELRPGIVAMLEAPDGTLTQGRVHSVNYREDGTMTVVAAVEPYDTGWISLAGSLISPATVSGSTLYVRRVGVVCEVVGNVVGSFTDGDATNIIAPGGVPADCRPGSPGGELASTGAHASSGYLAGGLVRADGSVAYWMRSGQTARNRLQFSITYLTT